MFNFFVIGPFKNEMFYIGYRTPGCDVVTPVMEFSSKDAAIGEADRLNAAAREKEEKEYFDREKLRKDGGLN
jgi:hypothetical protein